MKNLDNIFEKDQSGFLPDPFYQKECLDYSHNVPTHIYIPPGQMYIHVCPSCGYRAVLRPICVTC